MQTTPDGHTTHIHDGALQVRRAWGLWCAALLMMVVEDAAPALAWMGTVVLVGSLLQLASGIWVATRPGEAPTRGRLTPRRLTRLLLLAAAVVTALDPLSTLAQGLTGVELFGPLMLPLLTWGLVPLAFWVSSRRLVHPGTRLDRRVRRLIFGWLLLDGLTAAAIVPFVAGGLDGRLVETIFGLALLTWMLGATALWYTSSRVMRAFGDWGLAQHTDLAEYVATGAFRRGEAWIAFAEDRGWAAEAGDDGLDITGELHSRAVHVRILSAMVPASMEIEIRAPALAGLRVGPRGSLPDRQDTGDALLDRFLDVHADDPALLALLDGQHEALMEIFHAHPSARLAEGRADDAERDGHLDADRRAVLRPRPQSCSTPWKLASAQALPPRRPGLRAGGAMSRTVDPDTWTPPPALPGPSDDGGEDIRGTMYGTRLYAQPEHRAFAERVRAFCAPGGPPLSLEIGVDRGYRLLAHARRWPAQRWLGVEVRRTVLAAAGSAPDNALLLRADARAVLAALIPPARLQRVDVLFPTPSNSPRHLLLTPALVDLLARRNGARRCAAVRHRCARHGRPRRGAVPRLAPRARAAVRPRPLPPGEGLRGDRSPGLALGPFPASLKRYTP